MKTILIALILFSMSASAESLNKRIHKSVGDIAFDIEMQFPDLETAQVVAYEKCGKTIPKTPGGSLFGDDGESENGYDSTFFYTAYGKMNYYYKCH